MKSSSALPPVSSSRAFTLIELLVVIAIIAILAGLLLSTAGYMQEKAGRSRAEVEIKAMESALENYKTDNGTYPESRTDDANSTKILVTQLMPEAADKKVYFTFSKKMLSDPNNPYTSAVVDPFGNPYHYQFDPNSANEDKSGKGFFNLWSQGKGGTNATDPNKWIKNW